MTVIRFSVRFHQPFLVRSGAAAGGLDAVARFWNPLPASSLKGAMRHASRDVLRVPPDTVDEVFGRASRQGTSQSRAVESRAGAWAWTDAGPVTGFVRHTRPRNRVDPITGVVHPEALTFTEEFWQDPNVDISYAVEQVETLTPDAAARHTIVLQASVWAVTALGSWRNRSMGAVTIRPLEPLPDLSRRLAEVLG